MALVAADAICTLSWAGPWSATASKAHGTTVARSQLWVATAVFFAITLVDWWLMWSETRVMGRVSERMLHASRVKVFAHLQRLGVDYYEHEMAGRIMTRMTTDIDALSQLLQNGLVNALVNLVTFVGVGVRSAIVNPEARHRDRADPLRHSWCDDLVPIGVVTCASGCAPRTGSLAVNATLQEGLSGVPGVPVAMVGQVGESGRVQQCACVEYKLDWFRFIPAGRVGLRDRRRYCYEQASEQSQLRDSEKNDGQISRHRARHPRQLHLEARTQCGCRHQEQQLWPGLRLPSDYADRQSAQTGNGHHSDHDFRFDW